MLKQIGKPFKIPSEKSRTKRSMIVSECILCGKYFSQIKNGAKIRKIKFDLNIQELYNKFILQNKQCAISGQKISLSSKKQTASLDRIDSSLGYTKENCQWVHKDVNLMKNSFQEDYFLEICQKITDYQESKQKYIG